MPPAKPISSTKTNGLKRKHSETTVGAKPAKQSKKYVIKKTTETKAEAVTIVGEKEEEGEEVTQEEILALEVEILESRENYDKIDTLLEHFKDLERHPEIAVTAAVALCRTFCRLMAAGKLRKKKSFTADEVSATQWLKERYNNYFTSLYGVLNVGDEMVQNTALTILMRLVKEEAAHLAPPGDEAFFPHESFAKVVKAYFVAEKVDEAAKTAFVEKWVSEYDDVRYSFFMAVRNMAEGLLGNSKAERVLPALLNSVLAVENLPHETTDDIEDFYAIAPPSTFKSKPPPILSLAQHRRVVQEGWVALLRLPLTEAQCKLVLLAMTHRIVPSFTKLHLLMDFLTECCNLSGSIALLALNGLFHLISTKNLDYPNFYPRLYTLLTRDLFHMKYRSRFFRLLDVFLASTHLPATLVASFIKRMCRLCVNAPPGAIVIVVPFVYNLFKRHRACTYMMHRVGSVADREQWRKEGYPGDPFDENETDPMLTGAIDSCVWEIEMLMSHWHPNVATLCRIIGEQFTKEGYNLEDFLDHSYGSLFDAEAKKNIKKPPVVEYDIPKRIFSRPEGVVDDDVSENMLLVDMWNFE